MTCCINWQNNERGGRGLAEALVEELAKIADILSEYQEKIAEAAYLETPTRKRPSLALIMLRALISVMVLAFSVLLPSGRLVRLNG